MQAARAPRAQTSPRPRTAHASQHNTSKSKHAAAILSNPFGRPSKQHSFSTGTHFEHIIFPLLKSGFMEQRSLHNLLDTHPLIKHLSVSTARLSKIDFANLRGPHPAVNQTSISPERTQHFMAALFHFDLLIPSLIRHLGGNHTSSWRSVPALMGHLKRAIPQHDLTDIARVFTTGCPAKLNATSSRENFLEHWRYGNHPGLASLHNQLLRSLAKEDAHQYIMVFRSWLARFIPNLHRNPMGMVTRPGKDDRLTIDPSNRISPTSVPINSLTDIRNEPPITYALAFVLFLIRLYNLRVTYLRQELLQMTDDASGAFKTTKLQPDVAAAFAYSYGPHLCVPSASIFGSNTSPPNFEPIARARTELATALVDDSSFDESKSSWATRVTFLPPPDDTVQYVRTHKDTLNPGVLMADGTLTPTPFHMYVDDNM